MCYAKPGREQDLSRQEARIVAMITDLLSQLRAGRKGAEEALIEAVYPHLKRLAARRLRDRGRHVTLDTTELVHETYMRLTQQRECSWQDRAHFLAISARVMRRVLVDHARHRRSLKRGGDLRPATLTEKSLAQPGGDLDWLALDEALERLAEIDGTAARVVESKFFAGMTQEETAEALGISRPTVTRKWRFARAWLRSILERPVEGDADD
jgi:RNA polymerase sigma factor (TIGR02999 family)